MVARGRIVALWIVTMLLVTAMPMVVPTASADVDVAAIFAGGTTTPFTGVAKDGTSLTFRLQGQIGLCGGGTPDAARPPSIDIILFYGGFLDATDKYEAAAVGYTRTDGRFAVDLTVTARAAANFEGSHAIAYTVKGNTSATAIDCTGTLPTMSGNFPLIKIDTKLPDLSLTNLNLVPSSSPAVHETVTPDADSSDASVGTWAFINVTSAATDLVALRADTSAITGSATPTTIPLGNKYLELQLPASGSGVPELEGATLRTIRFTAVDTNGNEKTLDVQFSVDNKPDPIPASTVFTARLIRESNPLPPVPEGYSPKVTVRAHWDHATTEIDNYQLRHGGTFGTTDTRLAPLNVNVVDSLNSTVDLKLVPVDDSGNVDSSSVQSLAFPQITSITYGATPGFQRFIGGTQISAVNLVLGANTPSTPADKYRDVTLRIQAFDGKYLKTTSGTTYKDLTEAQLESAWDNETTFHPTGDLTGSSISIPVTGKALNDGIYTFNITVNATGSATGKLHEILTVAVDGQGPTISTSLVGGLALSDVTKRPHGNDGNPLQVAFSATEWRTGKDRAIDNVTVQLVYANRVGEVAVDARGVLASFDITRSNCSTLFGITCDSSNDKHTTGIKFNTTMFAGWANFSALNNEVLANLPPGEYKVRVLARDVAGNFGAPKVFDDKYVVAPRVALLTGNNQPFADSEGIQVSIFAAQPATRAQQAVPASIPCDATKRLCGPTNVTVYVRNVGTTSAVRAVDLAPSPTSPLVTQSATMFNGAVQTWDYYNITPTQRIPLTGLNANNPIEIMAVAGVAGADGITVYNQTAWTLVNTATTSALTLRDPVSDWFINSNGTLFYNLSYDFRTAGTSVTVRGTLTPLNPAGADVDLGTLTPAKVVDGYKAYNYTNSYPPAGTTLSDGEYRLRFEAFHAGDTAPRVTLDRYFAVEKDAPAVTWNPAQARANITIPQAEVGLSAATATVNRTFDVGFNVHNGFANITSDDQFTFKLVRTETFGNEPRILSVGDDGFNVEVKSHGTYTLSRSNVDVVLHVTLPGSAQDGQRFVLQVNATTDAKQTPLASYLKYSGVGQLTVTLDSEPPAGLVDYPGSNSTGLLSSGTKRAFIGAVSDTASGIKEVEVRVSNLTGNTTFRWVGAEALGVGAGIGEDRPDNWASSDFTESFSGSNVYARNVYVSKVGNVLRWQLNVTDRYEFLPHATYGHVFAGSEASPTRFDPMPVDFGSAYRVDLRITDNANHTVVILGAEGKTINFDPENPTVVTTTDATRKAGIQGPSDGKVSWHSVNSADAGKSLTVRAADNHCVESVALYGIAPRSGSVVGPAFFTPVTPCTGYSDGAVREWTLLLASAPNMTDEVGVWRYWFEARDFAGHVASAKPDIPENHYSLEVLDAIRPTVKFVQASPPVIAPGGSAIVTAEVFDDGEVQNVTLEILSITQAGSRRIAFGEMKLDTTLAHDATSRSGKYAIDTAADLKIDLSVGDYELYVRARDAGTETRPGEVIPECGACRIERGTMRVIVGAPLQVVQDTPAANAPYLNATPTFVFRVPDANVTEAGIVVETGDAPTNLSAVTANLTPILGAGGARTGYRVTYTPAEALDNDNFSIRVTASAPGAAPVSVTRNYTIDATPPELTHNVTGLVPLGNETWATGATRITITALENVSGPAVITYVENDGDAERYTSPITPSGAGEWRLAYRAVDGAGNVATGNLTLTVDRTGPSINVSKHGVDLLVFVTDNEGGAGVNESSVVVHYAFGTDLLAPRAMEKGVGSSYSTTLPGNASASGLKYWISAKDALGNEGKYRNAGDPFTIPKEDGEKPVNLPPTVRITAPPAGSIVRGTTELKWTASDPDDDPISITIARQDPTGPGRVLVIGGENSGSYTFNAEGLAAGTYTLVVTATDGQDTSAPVSIALSVEKTEPIQVGDPLPPTAQADQPVGFTVLVNPAGKTVSRVTYTVTKDGAPYANGSMRVSSGRFFASIVPTEAGRYAVSATVNYADGSSEPAYDVGSFEVQGGGEPVDAGPVPTSFILLLAMGALTVALAAYGAFVRWKK